MGEIKTRVSTLLFIVLPSLTLAQPVLLDGFRKVLSALAQDDGFRNDGFRNDGFRKDGEFGKTG